MFSLPISGVRGLVETPGSKRHHTTTCTSLAIAIIGRLFLILRRQHDALIGLFLLASGLGLPWTSGRILSTLAHTGFCRLYQHPLRSRPLSLARDSLSISILNLLKRPDIGDRFEPLSATFSSSLYPLLRLSELDLSIVTTAAWTCHHISSTEPQSLVELVPFSLPEALLPRSPLLQFAPTNRNRISFLRLV